MSSERLVVFGSALIYIFCVYSLPKLNKLSARDKSSDDRSIGVLFTMSRRAVATFFSKARRFLQESLERT